MKSHPGVAHFYVIGAHFYVTDSSPLPVTQSAQALSELPVKNFLDSSRLADKNALSFDCVFYVRLT
jgi:hypothetical protein